MTRRTPASPCIGWKELATETGAAVLLLVHTNRINSANTRDRYGATYALRQKARVTLYAQCDEEDRLLVGPDKMNNGAPTPASIFTIEPIQHFEPDPRRRRHRAAAGPRRHLGPHRRPACRRPLRATTTATTGAPPRTRAGWFQGYLEVEGPNADGADVKRAAAKNGFKERTLQKRRARSSDVVYGKSGFGKDIKVTWSLPTQVVRVCRVWRKRGHHTQVTHLRTHTRQEADAVRECVANG